MRTQRGVKHGRQRSAVALLAGALAALVACGGDGGGGGGSHPTPSPSATPFATPTATVAPTPFPIAVGLGPGGGVAAAWGGDRYLVTFGDATGPAARDVAGVRLTQDGEPVDAAPFPLSDFGSSPFLGPDARYSPGGIAFAGTHFGVFLYGAGTTQSGAEGQVVGFVSVPPDGPPALPATAIDEQLTFSMARTSLISPVAATTNGVLYLGMYQRILSLVGAFTVSQVVGKIVTATDGGAEAQPVGPLSGIVPPVGGIVTSGSAPGVATSDDATALVAWVETYAPEDSPGDVSTGVQSAQLTADSATFVRLADTAAGSQGTAVASDGTSFLVVWTATTAADPATLSELRAIRFTPGGTPEPAGGFLIGGGGAKQLGDVAFTGGAYLVTWIEDGALRGARLDTRGEEAAVFTIDPGPVVSAALAGDGTRFLAVVSRATGTSTSDVLGTFVPAQ